MTAIDQQKLDRLYAEITQLFQRADREGMLILIWALDALQSGSEKPALHFLRNVPPDAITSDMLAPYAFHKWELETAANLNLALARHGSSKINFRDFNTAVQMINLIKGIENTEASFYLGRVDVLLEMQRHGHRQFPWQRGFLNRALLCRYGYIYGQGASADFFQQLYGITVSDFVHVAFAMYAAFRTFGQFSPGADFERIGISADMLKSAMAVLSVGDFGASRQVVLDDKAAQVRNGGSLPLAYRPSLFRKFPIIAFGAYGNRYVSPLPALIGARATSGLYYDLVKGDPPILADANRRFEQYVERFFRATMEGFDVLPSGKYKYNGQTVDTPDVLVSHGGQIEIVVECKATKLSFDAQFSEDPLDLAKNALQQIAKGVLQLWQFFSRSRRQLTGDFPIAPDADGMVVTLDAWVALSTPLIDQIYSRANEMADADKTVEPGDRREVIICSVEELERTLAITNEDEFRKLLKHARNEKFRAWDLSGISKTLYGERPDAAAFPFSPSEFFPWWNPPAFEAEPS